MSIVKSYQKKIKSTVDKAISKAEKGHRSIAANALNALESIEKKVSLSTVKKNHDKFLANAYKKARGVNELVSDYASTLILKLEGEKATPKKRKYTRRNVATGTTAASSSAAIKKPGRQAKAKPAAGAKAVRATRATKAKSSVAKKAATRKAKAQPQVKKEAVQVELAEQV